MPLLVPALLGSLALLAGGPASSSRPLVTGTLQVGRQLTASPGSWSGAGTITYAYQWYRCDARGAHCSSIHGATRGTYREVPKDAGKTLALTVRATDPTGTTPAYAALAGLVAPAAATVAARSQPELGGSPVVGATLTVGQAVFTAAAAGAVTTSWLRCNENGRICAPIADARAATYAPVAADVGHVVLAAVSAGGRTVLSRSLGPVRAAPGPVALARPSITGTLRQGSKLTASAGTWSGAGTITYAYQWYRCDPAGGRCAAIRGATSGSYTEVARDVGKTLGLTVRATDSTGTTPAYSALAGLVAAPDGLAATAQPTLAGSATVGSPLSVSAGGWTATPASLAYAWLSCNANGRRCVPIAAANAATYAPVAGDRGHTLVAVVSATAGTAAVAVLTVASAVVP